MANMCLLGLKNMSETEDYWGKGLCKLNLTYSYILLHVYVQYLYDFFLINVNKTILQATLNGIDSVQKVLDSFREQGRYMDVVEGYFGTLIGQLDCEKTFFTCVEVTAGNR